MFKSKAEESGRAVNLDGADDLTDAVGGSEGNSSRRDESAVIGHDLRVAGDLECEGHIVIAGVVDGQIKGRGIVVTNDATVKGNIDCEAIQIFGEVEGQVSAGSVEIAETALVAGDVSYDALVVQDGATIDGRFKRRESDTL